ncbi:uncharacterized protein Bfra_004572 [Botrytis fragariae]|uniref:Uncharacterized protein n=1 Tax=Botrytis fragariae TaxID=1964551 RepID=A0A8H6EJH7_9HELO|nr:uncharacterized protein Bfra_004572 [Botrytis fragariae]KAF5874561.1 hypothetical protein Bfra_004572 [Botrytis fragariae]
MSNQLISSYDDLQLGRNDDFYDNPLDFTNFNSGDFEQFDNDPCSEFLNFFNDKPSSESQQDTYNIPPVITDASPSIFPFETLPNADVDDRQDMGSGSSRPRDEPCYAQSYARTPALDNSSVRADNIKRHISRRHAGQDIQVLRMETNGFTDEVQASPLMPCHEQTQWQQSESPQRYGYSNLSQQQAQALREQIAYEQSNFPQFPTNPYIISSDRQGIRNRFPSRRLTKKLAPFRFINSVSPVRNVFKSPAIITRMGELDFDKMLRSIEPGKSPTSMVTNMGTSSDSEEVSGPKRSMIRCGLKSFSKTTRRNKSYAKERLREAEITINKSIPTALGIGNMETAEDAFWEMLISKINGYLSEREKVNQVEIFTFFSEQVNQVIDLKSLSPLSASIDHAYGITGCLSPYLGW